MERERGRKTNTDNEEFRASIESGSIARALARAFNGGLIFRSAPANNERTRNNERRN